ncbi:lysine N(6)-hydroxylase/L-ornithine N(5)-oxygenase family protein [Streptomyces hoynatensis]|uniref:L-lysine N6-monooxygenase MbtG n=1 Tax=Streptomyces hoynatensis TaxID=1141874 RepID=A0A3A9Z2A5_9ACTN|nr:SidA/IucD/PvdA family monooxygenase [Streptomyces hoynatensis]RKN42365.1 lysine 6-monooxygenase [Streptomyces hoynatensis]
MTTADPNRPLDLAGVGIGPANLSLAALAYPLPGLECAWFEQRPEFRWHPGLLVEGTTLQVPFLADLVTLVDPTSRWSFLNYLRHQRRLFPFYFSERFHGLRAEYDAYCRWVSGQLPGMHFSHQVDAIRWNHEHALFDIDFTRLGPAGEAEAVGRASARNIVLGIGTAPHVPEPLRLLAEARTIPVVHSADYLDHRERLLAAGHVTVIGSGQSGAEVFLDLLRRRPEGRERLAWVSRTPAFAPMEYSKLGLEHFTPDYAAYFRALPEPIREQRLAQQWQLHKGIDHGTLAAIHDELYRRSVGGGWPDAVLTPGVTVRTAGRLGSDQVELHLDHLEQGERSRLITNALVLATGYRERPLDPLLTAFDQAVLRDEAGRPCVDEHCRLRLDPDITGAVFVQNAERHSHGVGAPDLGLFAHRSATILNSLSGEELYPLPERTAFTTFGLRPARPRVGAPRTHVFATQGTGNISPR